MPTIICPHCKTENRPAGLSALHCERCLRTIDPRQLSDSAEAFIRKQRKLRKKSAPSPGPLTEEEADELLEWVLHLPPNETATEGIAEPRRLSLRRLIGSLTGAAARRQRPAPLYTDSVVRLTEDGIVINQYYWPVGRKRIPYTEIRRFTARPLRAWHGQFRVHGIDHLGRWYSRDRHRGAKERAIDLTVGKLIHPVLTPDDIDAVLAILDRKITSEPA